MQRGRKKKQPCVPFLLFLHLSNAGQLCFCLSWERLDTNYPLSLVFLGRGRNEALTLAVFYWYFIVWASYPVLIYFFIIIIHEFGGITVGLWQLLFMCCWYRLPKLLPASHSFESGNHTNQGYTQAYTEIKILPEQCWEIQACCKLYCG